LSEQTLDAQALGQLLYLQSTLDVMPDAQGVVDLVCAGLSSVPGVDSVSYLESSDGCIDSDQRVSVASRQQSYGVFAFNCHDAEQFAGYKPHVQNVANTVALVFDNRGYIHQINRHSQVLEQRVQERTAALAYSEQQFQRVIETAGDAILGMDEVGAITLWNKAASEMFGYNADEAMGRNLHELIVPERYRKDAAIGMARFQQRGDGVNINKTIEQNALRRDGAEFPIELSISSMKTDQGWQAIGIVRDITERKQAEKTLRDSAVKLADAQRIGQMGNWEFDVIEDSGQFSDETYRIFGVADDYGRSFKSFLKLVHPDDRMLVKQANKKAIHCGSFANLQYRIVRPDESIRFVQANGETRIDASGKPYKIFGSIQDITERKMAEKILHDLHIKTDAMADTVSDVLYMIDSNAKVIWWNRHVEKITGLSAQEIQGKPAADFIVEEDWPKLHQAIERVLTNGEAEEELLYRTINGPVLHHFKGSAVKDNEGTIIGITGIGRDITELKRAETVLKQSEKRLQSMIEGNPLPTIITRMSDGLVKYANEPVSVLFRLPHDEVIGKQTPDYFVRPEERASMIQELAQSISTRSNEVQLRRPDGTVFWALVTLSMIEFDGEPSVMTSVYDITERKFSESFANQTSNILEMVATSCPASEIYNAICHLYEDKNPHMRASILCLKGDQLFHCSAPSLPADYSQAIDGANIGPCAGSCGTAAFFGKEVIVEDIASDPLWAEYKAVALPHGLRACWSEPVMGENGKVLGTFAMYFDQPGTPTEQELKEIRGGAGLVAIVMEREIREAMLHKLSQAIDHAGSSMLITNGDGVVEYVNPAFTALTGYSAEEAIGKTPRILKSGKQPDEFYESMWNIISSGQGWQGKVVDRKKDGSLFPAMLNIAPIADEHGTITYYVASHADLSELEEMEEQFRQAQKMEAVGTLVGGIAHDFNNMLAGMTGNIYLSKKHVSGIPEVVQKLDNVEQLAMRAADMIQQLLTFARKDRVNIKRMPFTPFIKETLKFLRPSVPENIAMQQDICSESLTIEGDATQLHQVLMNLVNNARDALDGVASPCITTRLDVFQADAEWIEHHAVASDAYAHLSVADNGCGIPEHQTEHLFEPFFTTKEQGKGTGLGLAMVFGAIKTHHGIIDVDSVEGEGTTFHVYLPLPEPEDVLAATSIDDGEVCEGNGEMILLADDEQHILDTGKEVLESLGYRVVTARNGERAVELFAEHADTIDLCLFDIVMPVMGGDQAANRIRKMNPNMKIIFATGYDKNTQDHLVDEVVLSKPFSVVEMSQVICQQLGY